jgi:methionyl-tRNA formyltransferase
VDWKLPAHLIDRQVRGCTPDPGAWTELEDARVKLWPVTRAAGASLLAGSGSAPKPGQPAAGTGLAPGELRVDRNAVYVGTGSVPVRLGDVQPPGKRRMPATDWARGLRTDAATALSFS